MLEIIPGILEKEWGAVERKLQLIKPFAKTIHIDLLDGKFAPNTSLLDPAPFAAYKNDFYFELHMMVDEPISHIESWAAVGVKRFLGHIEKMRDQEAFVRKAKQFGEACLAIDGPTPVNALTVAPDTLDGLLVMTITAGFSGQQFVVDHLSKVSTLRAKTQVPIEVDGGVTDKTITLAKDAGATRFITTSYLFRDDPQQQYETLKSCLGV